MGNMRRVIKVSNPFLKPRTRSNILHLKRLTAIISEKSLCKKVSQRKKSLYLCRKIQSLKGLQEFYPVLSAEFFRSAVLLLHKEEFGGTLEQSITSDLGLPL